MSTGERDTGTGRERLTTRILAAKRERNLTFAELGKAIGRSEVWTAAAIFGQASMSDDEATALAGALGLDPDACHALTEVPTRGSLPAAVPVDPLLYRFYEIIQVYGPAVKGVVTEKFGDGIMSAIDFTMSIERRPDPHGDRVVVTYDGKFLPYRKW